MTVEFREFYVCDMERSQTVEDSFKAYAGFASIHDFKLDKMFNQSTNGLTNWSTIPSASVASTSGNLAINTGGLDADLWYHTLQSGVDLPASYLIKFSTAGPGWAALLNWRPAGDFYLVGVDDTSLFVIKYNGTSYDTVMSIPNDVVQGQDVIIAFREQVYSSEEVEDDIWLSISMWINESLALTFIEKETTSQSGTVHFGLAVKGDEEQTFTNLYIPEITEFAEWSSLDPGENPMDGLGRSIDGRYLKFFMRGATREFRAWRPKTTPSVMTIPADIIDSSGEAIEKRDIKTHIRQVGAYVEAEYHDPTLTRKYGHRFGILNNPYIMSKADCYVQARRSILRILEGAITEDFEMPVSPLIEIEDHITTPLGERVIVSKDIESMTALAIQQIHSRTYILGS